MCSGAAIASQRLISGKLNALIDLFVGKMDAPTRRTNERRIETKPAFRARRFRLFHGAFNPCKDELARGTALGRSGFANPAVKVAGQVDRSADGIRLHTLIVLQ